MPVAVAKIAHELDYTARKTAWDEVQRTFAEELPMIWLVKQHEVVGARSGLGNYRPKVLRPQNYWNLEELYWQKN